jgi:hypothetical protein
MVEIELVRGDITRENVDAAGPELARAGGAIAFDEETHDLLAAALADQ